MNIQNRKLLFAGQLLIFFLVILCCNAAKSYRSEIAWQIANFVSCNIRHSTVNIVSITQQGNNTFGISTGVPEEAKKLATVMMTHGLQASVALSVKGSRSMDSDVQVIIPVGELESDFAAFLTRAYDTLIRMDPYPRRSIIVLPEEADQSMLYRDASLLGTRSFISNSHFFVASVMKGEKYPQWFQVITVQGQTQVVVNSLQFSFFPCVREQYDLQKLNVTSTSVNWYPLNVMEGCDQNGMHCTTSSGIAVELGQYIAGIANFSVHNFVDPNGDWGVFPRGGKWRGAMGDVINGKYPISLSGWVYSPERYVLLDFVHLFNDDLLLVLVPQLPRVDFYLFTRPFTQQSWKYIATMTCILVTVAAMSYFMGITSTEQTTGNKLLYIVTMSYFVVLNAYYGGALTMFFTKSPSVPFETLRDVMRNPSWKLIVLEGSWVVYQHHKNAGDKDFVQLWKRMVQNPEETFYKDIDDGIKRIKNGRYVLHTSERYFSSWASKTTDDLGLLKVFGKGFRQQSGIIMAKKSPLRPIFKLAMQRLQETANYERMVKSMLGFAGSKKGAIVTTKTFMVYLVMSVAVVASMLILVIEKMVSIRTTTMKQKCSQNELVHTET